MRVPINGNSDAVALVDSEDYEVVSKYKWYLVHGYAHTTFHKKGKSRQDVDRNVNISMHRLIMGKPPMDGLIVDHCNRDRLDNRRSNLRWVTYVENAHNSESASGYKGVSKDRNRWVAQIRGLFLGSYEYEVQAAKVYDKAARHFFKKYAYLNFPDDEYGDKVRYVDYAPNKHKPKSIYTGVSYFGHGGKRVKRWRAVYRKKTIGYFLTEIEAAQAYIEAKSNDC